MLVAAGEVDLSKLSETGQKRFIERHIEHPSYDPVTKKNDICLLILNRTEIPLEFNDNVGPIGLDHNNYNEEVECSISGWGSTSSEVLFVYDFFMYQIVILNTLGRQLP